MLTEKEVRDIFRDSTVPGKGLIKSNLGTMLKGKGISAGEFSFIGNTIDTAFDAIEDAIAKIAAENNKPSQ